MAKVLARESGKKIGKFGANHCKLATGELHLHPGHQSCIQALRDDGVEIVIVEFFNIVRLGYDVKPVKMKGEDVLAECQRSGLDADYIIWDSPDIEEVTPETVALVQQRMADENYVEDLNLYNADSFEQHLRWITQRDNGGFTLVRCWKTGADSWGYKHYVEKYLTDLPNIVIDPETIGNSNIPYTGEYTLETTDEGLKGFTEEFYASTSNSKVNLNKIAKTYEGRIEGHVILKNTKYVPEGRTFVGVWYVRDDGFHCPVSKLI